MSDEIQPPRRPSINGPFNRVPIVDNKEGTTVIMDSPIALLVLSFLSIVMLFQLIRMFNQNRKLQKRCGCNCECCQGCKNKNGECTCDCECCKCCKNKKEECNCEDCSCEDA